MTFSARFDGNEGSEAKLGEELNAVGLQYILGIRLVRK
jgi:hypothetical protein